MMQFLQAMGADLSNLVKGRVVKADKSDPSSLGAQANSQR